MKSFHDQYVECEEQGMHILGKIEKFKDHPELLPLPWHSAAPKLSKKLEEDPEFGLTPVTCLRFGGKCSSGHLDCQKMRKLWET